MRLNDMINKVTLQTYTHLENMTVLNSRLQNITFYMKHTFSQTKIKFAQIK